MNAKSRRKARRKAQRGASRPDNVVSMRGAYEGATRSYRMGNKGLSRGGPNSSVVNSLSTLVSRSRDAIRNNPVAATTANSYVANLVGTGAIARWPDADLQRLWERWILECDADEHSTFAGLQAMTGRAQFSDGESLMRFRYRPDSSQLSVPLQLQVLEADYLDPSYNIATPQKTIVAGKQLNRRGQVTRYHLFQRHPADHQMAGFTQKRFSVRAKDVVHTFKAERPGQLRGTPALSSVLLMLNELDQMVDAAVVRAKLAEMFGAFVTTAADSVNSPLVQELEGKDPDGENFNDPAHTPLAGITSGGIHFLEPGEEVEFSNPPKMENLDSVLKYVLRTVARVAGLTAEQVSGDLSDVNFSSLRAGLTESRRLLEMLQQDLIINQFCRQIAARWLYVAAMSGRWNAPADYWGNPHDYMPKWMMPKFRHVQPVEDAKADIAEVRAGFATLASKQMERGYWPDDINSVLTDEQGLELVLDSNPLHTAANGKLQADTSSGTTAAAEPPTPN